MNLKCFYKFVALFVLAAASHVADAGVVFDWVTGKFCDSGMPQKSSCMHYWGSRIISGHHRNQALSVCKSYCAPSSSSPSTNYPVGSFGSAAACNLECDRQYRLDN